MRIEDVNIDMVNSQVYWENRFHSKDWEKYDGEKQSVFFAETALHAFPDWLRREMNLQSWDVTDWGCAEGAGTAVLAKEFPSCRFTGVDFSSTAVEQAQKAYPYCEFVTGDITEGIWESDVIFSSNTLEHFKSPMEMLLLLVGAARQHAVILVPLHDMLDIKEHFSRFSEDFFPLDLAGHSLSYFRIIDCLGNPYWPGEQLLLVYSAQKALPQNRRLADLFSNQEYIRLKAELARVLEERRKTLEEKAEAVSLLTARLEENRKAQAEDAEAISRLTAQLEENRKAQAEDAEVISRMTAQLEESRKAQAEDAEAISRMTAQLDESRKAQAKNAEIISSLAAQTEGLQAENASLTVQDASLQMKFNSCERRFSAARQQLYTLADTKLFRLVHFFTRLKHQGFSHDRRKRKSFRRWLFSHFRHVPNTDHSYNPLFFVIDLLADASLDTVGAQIIEEEATGQLADHLRQQNKLFDTALASPLSQEAQRIQAVLSSRTYKGILIYPHVVYWEPLQTPQQLLRAFAKEGWLCFFCELPTLQGVCREVEPNLFITYESDFLQAVGDRPVTVLQTWMGSQAFVDRLPNKTVWYCILDHLQIFAYYGDFYLKLHQQALTSAVAISYVAAPLRKWAGERADTIYLPNGVNASEIASVREGFIPPDMKPILTIGHKIIGYYGYLAEWMDYNMVREMAQSRPDWEFVMVGKAIHDTALIENIPNIHLLGLKPYRELPDYAKFFDVATIPFLINEKMDCVSPIKFYEYLALGKPVVTSRMKELEPYATTYDFISCACGKDEFLFYLDKSLQPEIQQSARENGPAIAAQNSWAARVEQITPFLLENIPLVVFHPNTKPDIVVFAIIDYDFRHQRPQHFARRLAQRGHRVYYINANFGAVYALSKIEENLWQVTLPGAERCAIHLTDWQDNPAGLTSGLDRLVRSCSIRDAVMIVDYPNWVHSALYLRKKYGFCMVTDYMDDFTGFLNPAAALVRKNCDLLLRESDGVMASSQFLYGIATKYNSSVTMNRNGTEFNYFHQAYQTSQQPKKRPVIGYYGAIAEWFNASIVCRCAERFAECDIVLVGNITEHREQLQQYSNIRLIGEVPYAELLPWLQSFDVCLIPFDASTDLIKATNPVKFYEYLSAGKKIVATEIPELKPYDGRFAYLANDPEEFCNAVASCLEGADRLATPEECFAFAKENDWDARVQVLERMALIVYPKISVIVLCYNQLDYTRKCVESVLSVTAYPNYELVLVDNCSADATADYLSEVAATHKNVKIILNKTNRGFAGGNNDGIAVSDGDYFVLLNNDTIVTRGWLSGLLKHFRNDRQVGLVGPVTNSIGNEARIHVNYTEVDGMPAFADAYTYHHMGEEYPHHGILAMFCLMISRTLYDKVGPLDEHYGMGMFEDDDYSMASQKLGYRNVLAEDVFIHHFGSVSFSKLEDHAYMALHRENRQYYEQKWDAKWIRPHFRPGV